MTILVTGAPGFVGRALIDELLANSDYKIFAAVRKLVSNFPSVVEQWKFDGISATTDWNYALQGIDCIIHTAARVHIMSDTANDPREEFREINTKGTLNLARQASESDVKRFVYISSIKVNGESTQLDMPFIEDNKFVPTDPYALSKYEAELGLLELAKKTQMEVVIIRPPLVYGPGVKANFQSMMKWLYKGVPLPFGSIHNKRSLVALDNLVNFIITCIDHPAAANQVFLVSDGEDLSTTQLLSRVAIALGKKPRLLPVNQQMLELGLKLVSKKDLAQRLCSSLQVDISKAEKLLNWTPPVSVDEGLRKTAEHFLESQSK
jgi:nucleoside-diphosphate-sugar epimerase